MDPNLFSINYERTLEVLVTIAVLSMIVERTLSLLFESRPFIEKTKNIHGLKEAISFIVCVAVCIFWFDALTIIISGDKMAILGMILTGGIYLIDNVAAGLLNADVLVAAHHGADNASCEMFISKVSPEFVIFSAGNAHRHPRQSTAERFIDFGVDPDNIFRTDKGYVQQSDGGICKQEWADGSATDGDTSGDDHVKQGKLEVEYLTPVF